MSKVYVGPARVQAITEDGRAAIQVLGGSCERAIADWALPYRYQPVIGDLLLVMGQNSRYWVTGVVRGQGRSELAFCGDTQLHAAGTMRLGGDGGVRIEGPQIDLLADQLETEADDLVQYLGSSESTVRGTFNERAGQCSRIIDEDDHQIAGRHATVAGHAVKMDGEMLRLS